MVTTPGTVQELSLNDPWQLTSSKVWLSWVIFTLYKTISLLPLKPADQEIVKVLDVVLDISRLCGGSGLTVGLNRKYKMIFFNTFTHLNSSLYQAIR